MKYKHLLSVLTVVCLMISLFDPLPGKTIDINSASPQALLSQPLGYFTENKGQWKDDILYMGRTPSGNVLLGETMVIYHDLENTRLIQTSFVDSNAFQVMEKDPLPHYHNYLIGNDPAHWGIECRNFQQILLNNVWDGIDVKYTFAEEGLKKEFHIHPGASIHQIQLEINEVAWGSSSSMPEASEQSSFFLDANLSAYTKDSATSLDISIHCQDSLLFFEGETVSSSEPVIIESLVYASYMGGSHNDSINSIAVDDKGHLYAAGSTNSDDFPMSKTPDGESVPGYDQVFKDSRSGYVVKLNPEGTELVYATYLGGSHSDGISSIIIDNEGYVYLAGSTKSPDFPMSKTPDGESVPGYHQTFKGSQSAFIVKLNPEGTELEYATYLGGANSDRAHALTIDSRGYAYIAGRTTSSDFSMSKTNGGEPAHGYNQTHTGQADACVVKLNPEGTELEYATYLGGSKTDAAYAIAVDSEGSAYVAGFTYSDDFPMSKTVGGEPAPGYDKEYRGTFDDFWQESSNAFVVKFNPEGTELEYATYLGGSGIRFGDFANDIALDQKGNLYITGRTTSFDFPMSRTVGGKPAPGYDHLYKGGGSSFVVKLNTSGTELEYATFLGGSQLDWASSIALDHQDNIYVGGSTWSDDFQMGKTPGGEPAPGYSQTFKSERFTGFLLKLNTNLEPPSPPDPTIALSHKALDFYAVAQGFLSSQSFQIENKGMQPLDGSLYSPSSGINIVPENFRLEQCQSIAIKVTLDPHHIEVPGLWESYLQIISNDPNQSEIMLPVQAYLDPPTLSMDEAFLDFGPVNKNDTFDLTLSLGNRGGKDLFIAIHTLHEAIESDQRTLVLSPRTQASLSIKLHPNNISKYGKFECTLRIESNDPQQAEIILPVRAYLMKPPRLEIGSITLVEPGVYHFLLHNKGEADLSGKLATEVGFLEIEPSEFVISSETSLKITLSLVPEAIPKPGVLHTVIQIQSNDPELPEAKMEFTANYGIHIVLTIGKLQSMVNEKEVALDVPPMIMEGRTLVPLRFIAEGFGASVEWLPEADQEIQVKLGDQRIRLWIGNQQALIETLTEQSEVQSTEEITLEVAPLIREGRTLVPLRFIAEGFGASVEWDGTLQQVTIYYWG